MAGLLGFWAERGLDGWSEQLAEKGGVAGLNLWDWVDHGHRFMKQQCWAVTARGRWQWLPSTEE